VADVGLEKWFISILADVIHVNTRELNEHVRQG